MTIRLMNDFSDVLIDKSTIVADNGNMYAR